MTRELDVYELLLSSEKGQMTSARIRAIRRSYGATQASFAELIMINYETYRSWEQGRRFPSSPGYAILCIAESYPKIFLKNWRTIVKQVKQIV